jgi:hypothetical protein
MKGRCGDLLLTLTHITTSLVIGSYQLDLKGISFAEGLFY